MTQLNELYGKAFLKHNKMTAIRSARELVPFLYDLLQPESVLDFGCAEGSFLDVFLELDTDIFTAGYDGPWIPQNLLHYWVEWDVEEKDGMPPVAQLNKDIDGNVISKSADGTLDKYDLALCLEVGEHLPKKYAKPLVRWLCDSAHAVAFGAAIPKQGGTRHINCQWQSWWAALFEECGYVAWDCIRPKFWETDEIDWWYTQNTVLYIDPSIISRDPYTPFFPLDFYGYPLDLVHPGLWHEGVR